VKAPLSRLTLIALAAEAPGALELVDLPHSSVVRPAPPAALTLLP
jgi:hypothetical protein